MITKMVSLSMFLSPSALPPQSLPKNHKSISYKTLIASTKLLSLPSITKDLHFSPNLKLPSSPSSSSSSSSLQTLILTNLLASLPCHATETAISSVEGGKIDIESILVSIDDFFNRYPFFVAGCTFIWLIVIPVAEFYLSKFKPIYAIDAFRKLKGDPNAQLLDIRDEKTLVTLRSPNLKLLRKTTVQVQFKEGDDDDGFVRKVKERFPDPENTVLCVLDNFDGNSMKVAELLCNNGFKEAYAIKNGVRGKDGWLAIQEKLLPPSLHILPRKKDKISKQVGVNGGLTHQPEVQNEGSIPITMESQKLDTEHVDSSQRIDDEHVNDDNKSLISDTRPLSPYPNYPDLKPPSSPTPSKP